MSLRRVVDMVGGTPLVALERLGRPAHLYAKLESRNPSGSVKDRVAAAMIDDAEKRGVLKPGATLVEPTSGNTGIALAVIAAARGYPLVLTMPERMSAERVALLEYLGAEVVLTPGALMREAVDRARAIAAERPGALMLDQFANPANVEAHKRTTAEEIWRDTGGEVDVFVAGVGTGGTISGVGAVLKAHKPSLRVVAVEPQAAAVLSGQKAGNHLIQGIGAGFVPALLDRSVIDEVVAVSDEAALTHARRLAREEGVAAGISSGATLAAALTIAARPEHREARIVFMASDGVERYLTTPLMEVFRATPPRRAR